MSLIKGLFELFKRVFLLFFNPSALVQISLKHTPVANPDQIREGIGRVRNNVFRAFRISGGTAFLSIIVYLILCLLGIHPEHRILAILRFVGYVLVLWGVFSPTGWGIRTIGGETLPEIIDEEWHRLVYMTGLFILLLSYLFEL